jgi:hypothetical protein
MGKNIRPALPCRFCQSILPMGPLATVGKEPLWQRIGLRMCPDRVHITRNSLQFAACGIPFSEKIT